MPRFQTKFRKGQLTRQIGLLGLTQREFAELAGLDQDTITRACQGLNLNPKSWGLIVRALGEAGKVPA